MKARLIAERMEEDRRRAEAERRAKAERDNRRFITTIEEFNDVYWSDSFMTLKRVIRSYRLTAQICAQCVIFNDYYAAGNDDSYVDTRDVLSYQPHLTREEIDEYD
jgi:hypothetical protein